MNLPTSTGYLLSPLGPDFLPRPPYLVASSRVDTTTPGGGGGPVLHVSAFRHGLNHQDI
jgi:hypothetical protein